MGYASRVVDGDEAGVVGKVESWRPTGAEVGEEASLRSVVVRSRCGGNDAPVPCCECAAR